LCNKCGGVYDEPADIDEACDCERSMVTMAVKKILKDPKAIERIADESFKAMSEKRGIRGSDGK
jgi:hypothetical protein